MSYYVKKIFDGYYGYGVFMVGFHYPIIENITLLKAHQEIERLLNKRLKKLNSNTTKNLRIINSETETNVSPVDEITTVELKFVDGFEKIRSSIKIDLKGY